MFHLQNRIHAFHFIREIPYHIPVKDGDKCFTCAAKSHALASMLKDINIQSRVRLCEFDWQDGRTPKEVIDLYTPWKEPDCHQFLEVLVPETNEWVTVDPTWDSPLASIGFTIQNWDGQTATRLAVKPTRLLTVEESAEKLAEYAATSQKDIDAYVAHHKAFFIAFNNWLDSGRK